MTKRLDEIEAALKAHREAGEDGGPTELEMHCGEYLSYTLRIARAAERILANIDAKTWDDGQIETSAEALTEDLRDALEGKE